MAVAGGSKLAPYEILAPIGAGGMGEVYRACDPRLGRDVALKILPAVFASDPDRIRRFEQEGRAAAALNHPNIVVIYDVGSEDGVFYVVTELLEGETLRERLAGTALPIRKAIDYDVLIARGLAAAHAKGIIHRDLKPENRRTGEPENRRTGEPENRRTGEPVPYSEEFPSRPKM